MGSPDFNQIWYTDIFWAPKQVSRLKTFSLAAVYVSNQPLPLQKHEIPLGAIPCLQYRKALEQEEQKKKSSEGQTQDEGQTRVNGHDGGDNLGPQEEGKLQPGISSGRRSFGELFLKF